MRLDKLLSMLNYGSRKDIMKLAKSGVITVNGHTIKNSSVHVDPEQDTIKVEDNEVFYKESLVIMMHKPSGVVSANHDALHKTVFDLLKEPLNRLPLNIAGRLDIDTEGLLILSNDGDIIHHIIHPKKSIYKTYLVHTKEPLKDISLLLNPMTLMDGRGRPYHVLTPKVKTIEEGIYEVKIKEGKFHQIKEMFKAINHEVIYLKRTKIHELALDETLPKGGYKVLTKDEINKLIAS